MHVKKVRDEDYVQWLLEFFTNKARVFKWTSLSGSILCPVLGTIMVDAGSRAASVTIHGVMDIEQRLGIVSGAFMLHTLLNHWIKCYGKPNIDRTDPEGAFRDQEFRRGLAAKSIRLDIDPGDASWKTGVLGKTPDTIKQSAVRVARRSLDSVTIQEIFDECTTAHNDLH